MAEYKAQQEAEARRKRLHPSEKSSDDSESVRAPLSQPDVDFRARLGYLNYKKVVKYEKPEQFKQPIKTMPKRSTTIRAFKRIFQKWTRGNSIRPYIEGNI